MTTSLRLKISLLSLCALPCGCDDPGAEPSTEPSADITLTPVEGLTVTARQDHVEGSFTRGDATIDFLLERDGDTRTALLTASDGAPLLESIAEPGHETVTLFGGRAVLSGTDPSAEPHVEGDASALAELQALPEGRNIAELHAALEQAGVDPVLLGAEPADDEVSPRLHFDGTWWNLYPNESVNLGTWGWMTYTHIAMKYGGSGPYYILYDCVSFIAGAGAWDSVCGPQDKLNVQARQFWGVPVTIKNSSSGLKLVRTY